MTDCSIEKPFILVTDATDPQGSAMVRYLLQQGFSVKAFIDDPERSDAIALADDGAELFVGDLSNRTSVNEALQNVDRVFSVQTYHADYSDMEVQQGRVIADAAKAASVSHFIYISSSGANRQTNVPLFRIKGKIEDYIRSIALPYTILRPTFYMHNWMSWQSMLQKGILPQPLRPETMLQQVSVEDVSAVATLAFAHPHQWITRELDLASDELTMEEIAQIFSQVLARPVNYVQTSWDRFEQEVGTERTALYRWLENAGYNADISVLRQEHPSLLTFKRYLQLGTFSLLPRRTVKLQN